jgi:YHS domain-containing protein
MKPALCAQVITLVKDTSLASVIGLIELTRSAEIIYETSSAKNKELLTKNPSKYEPVYGGWCAFAMGDNGEKVEINPTTFKIINGKTYLFYNKLFTNTLNSWNKNEETLKKQADQNWKKITTK